MERFEDSNEEDDPQRPVAPGLLRRLRGIVTSKKGKGEIAMATVTQPEIEVPEVSDQGAEPQAKYSVASESSSPVVTSLTSDQITHVFDLYDEVSKLPKRPADSD